MASEYKERASVEMGKKVILPISIFFCLRTHLSFLLFTLEFILMLIQILIPSSLLTWRVHQQHRKQPNDNYPPDSQHCAGQHAHPNPGWGGGCWGLPMQVYHWEETQIGLSEFPTLTFTRKPLPGSTWGRTRRQWSTRCTLGRSGWSCPRATIWSSHATHPNLCRLSGNGRWGIDKAIIMVFVWIYPVHSGPVWFWYGLVGGNNLIKASASLVCKWQVSSNSITVILIIVGSRDRGGLNCHYLPFFSFYMGPSVLYSSLVIQNMLKKNLWKKWFLSPQPHPSWFGHFKRVKRR